MPASLQEAVPPGWLGIEGSDHMDMLVPRRFNMDISVNEGFFPQIIHFKRAFHYKPSILGYPYFWKHPYGELCF